MAQFKGTIYLSTALFTEQRFGSEATNRVIAALPEEDQQVLRDVTAIGWYPTAPIMAFHRKLDELYGSGDLALCVEVGKFSAEWTLNAVLKMFLRFRTPNWLMERSSSLWVRFHDSGRWEILEDPNVPLLARLHDFKVRDEAFCARFQGWLHGAIELTGGKEAHVTHPRCACKGGRFCEFNGRWK
ncbi:MAG: hypothetical protein OXR73_17270 [Myxococcales bacterium]|nr:hypothetical protein [Myxococcales bacterium]